MFFVKCQAVKSYWMNVSVLLHSCGISKNLCSLQYILEGYTIVESDYFYINIVLSLLGLAFSNHTLLVKIGQKTIKYLKYFLL